MSISADEALGGGGVVVPRLEASDVLAWAKYYLSLGWAVTAGPGIWPDGSCACREKSLCRNPGKHAYPGWGDEKRVTMNEEQVEAWWGPANAGRWLEQPVDQLFIVPYLSGLAVADVDRMDEWLALDESMRVGTLFQQSGSGRGGHYLYRYDWDQAGPAPSLPGRLPGGAGELKFRGIIAACPSVHPSGGRYTWDEATWFYLGLDGGLPEIPPELLVRRAGKGIAPSGAWGTIENIPQRSEAGSLDSNKWLYHLLMETESGFQSVAEATSSRPVILFAVAASCAVWIETGWMDEETVVQRLVDASEQNGSLNKYGQLDIERQIRNGIEAGKRSVGEAECQSRST